MQAKENTASIESHFGDLNDPRHHNKKHKLLDIMVIAICATICGADTFDQIADFGKSKIKWFRRFLELPYGIPAVVPKNWTIC
jgi:hypothetical protein